MFEYYFFDITIFNILTEHLAIIRMNVEVSRIRRGQCATCGIQTHEPPLKGLAGILANRSRIPLTNNNVLSGRCLLCNSLDSGGTSGAASDSASVSLVAVAIPCEDIAPLPSLLHFLY